MAKLPFPQKSASEPPSTYADFIARMRRFVESKGVTWAILVAKDGSVSEEADWDLRMLTGSHSRFASRTNGFAIDWEAREAAVEAGWAAAHMPEGQVLSHDTQEFIKAVIACRCRQHIVPRSVRHEASVWRTFFSLVNKAPWDLNSDDFNRFMALREWSDKAVAAISVLANEINENMLSENVPVGTEVRVKAAKRLQTYLDDRRDSEKLPDPKSLHELVRIVFQETPVGHQDRIRFYALRLLLFTGLRFNEVLMLPADCLSWEDHVDVVTGQNAGEIGGVGRTLWLRYFGEKRDEGRPDVLVEDRQFVPEQFQRIIIEAVEGALAATASLRAALKRNPQGGRRFKTAGGDELGVLDLLFLVLHGGTGELPAVIPGGEVIEVVAESSFYAFLTSRNNRRNTIFTRYGNGPDLESLRINPHSLRHLMNTEFFRLNIPDTVITHHFGRTTVAQSHKYDHRSLGEQLSFVELPKSAQAIIAPGSVQETVAKMVLSGFVGLSHVAESFKKIQQEHGDEAAFTYLAATSDGFHVTPYGFCTTSFAVNPCVRHLKCFHKCKRYVPSGLPEHRITLEELRGKLSVMREKAAAKPANSIGRKNQIAHADELLAGVDAALSAHPGTIVFPDGKDYSEPEEDVFA
ncbi:hypothetical protein M3I53_20310 [Paraburkholderia sp. CNPSo 3272]|uniref:hypothetical protein n=1 Tax=Paraburkholderia sp. CNPSo 3272 TaxID=2940931 RepID=UPI0020B83420|nr:hypothetical protein [Paraburkholderia sp. CNPSo 3272]MCP3725437.1 hypothetical protein [Paraburkholderia sp. CNPSo 3272]